MKDSTPLQGWLAATGATARAAASELGVSASTFARYASGEMACDADMVERIEALTGAVVTAQDMHETRLAWLRTNRPDKFTEGVARPEAGQ